ncbi:MAG: hypothetical protein SGARI_001378 [Bacillariaceae sp.]
MWFYDQVVGNTTAGDHEADDSDTDGLDQALTFEGLTSGDDESLRSVPPPPPSEDGVEDDEGVEIHDVLDKLPEKSTVQEVGAIEVEAAGAGFARKSVEGMDEKITVLSASDCTDEPPKIKPKKKGGRRRGFSKKQSMCLILFVVIALLLLIGGLTYGAIRNSNKNQQTSVAALTGAEDEADVGIINVDLTEDDTTNDGDGDSTPADTPATSAPGTQTTAPVTKTNAPSSSPTAAATMAVTPEGTFMPTEISCSSDHNIMVGSTCDTDGFETWTATRVLYCFSRVRDGDWYWIRSVDGEYDRWDYTEGSSEGMLDFAGMPEGNYLISLVRDSMRPYDIILTQDLVVPNCANTTA